MLFDYQITIEKFIDIFESFDKVVLFDQQDLKFRVIMDDDIFLVVENFYIKGYGNEDLYFYRKDNYLINVKDNMFYLNGRTKDGSEYMKRIVVNKLDGSAYAVYSKLKHPFNTLKEKVDSINDAIKDGYITFEKGQELFKYFFTDEDIKFAKFYGIEIPKLINRRKNNE